MPLKESSFTVRPDRAGRTLSSLLHDQAEVSHSTARGLVRRGLVNVNGKTAKDPAARLSEGDEVRTRFDTDTRYASPAGRRGGPTFGEGFRALLEDEHLIVVDKEAGILSVPAPGHEGGTLVDRLLAGYRGRGHRAPRLWVVHRIDRFTSGLVLFARTEQAASRLIEQFEKRTASREYLAICEGVPDRAEGRLESWMSRDPASMKMRQSARRGAGQHAVCRYTVEQPLREAALLRVRLETGRRNQIRVQLAGARHPVLGDRTYGRPSELIDRPALHAARLGFTHPESGRAVRVESALPADIRRCLRLLRRLDTSR